MDDLPPTSLIICSRNRPRLLLETVETVLKGNCVPRELIIIDQSNIALPELAERTVERDCRLRYVLSSSTGVCRARNEGAALASQPLLVFIDDDMLVPPDWFGILVEALVCAGPDSVVCGRVLPGPAELPGGFVPALVEEREPHTYQGRINTDVLTTCHMAMYGSLFRASGGLDERLGPGTRFPAGDDNEYGFRLLEAGYRIVFTPQAVIHHRAWRSEQEYYPLRWNYGRGKGGFYTKYISLRDPYLFKRMLNDLSIRFIRFPWRVLHKPRLALGDLYYAFGMISGSIEWAWTYWFNQAPPTDTRS